MPQTPSKPTQQSSASPRKPADDEPDTQEQDDPGDATAPDTSAHDEESNRVGWRGDPNE